MTLSPGSSSVRIGIHRWTIDTIFRGPAAGQRSVALSTGLRAGFRSPKRTIATGRYRRSSHLSRPRLDTVPQDRHSDRGRDFIRAGAGSQRRARARPHWRHSDFLSRPAHRCAPDDRRLPSSIAVSPCLRRRAPARAGHAM